MINPNSRDRRRSYTGRSVVPSRARRPSPHRNHDADRSPKALPLAVPPIRPVRRTGQRRSVRRIVGWCQIREHRKNLSRSELVMS